MPKTLEPVEKQILDVISQRLSMISIANGFHTDAGQAIFWGKAPAEQAVLPLLIMRIPEPIVVLDSPESRLIRSQMKLEIHSGGSPV